MSEWRVEQKAHALCGPVRSGPQLLAVGPPIVPRFVMWQQAALVLGAVAATIQTVLTRRRVRALSSTNAAAVCCVWVQLLSHAVVSSVLLPCRVAADRLACTHALIAQSSTAQRRPCV